MNKGLFGALAVAAGLASALQGAINGALAGRVGLGSAVLVNATVVMAGASTFWWLSGAETSFFPPGTPWWLYTGGFCGVVIIAGLAAAFPRLGAGLTIALLVLGQGLMALALDHFGALGLPREPVSLTRLAGIALLAGGMLLLRWRPGA